MYLLMVFIFVLGYLAIAFEHSLKIDKAAVALLIGVLCWTILITSGYVIFPDLTAEASHSFVEHRLMEHLGDIAGILFFLLGAMTIVELIDAHEGFSVITDKITTRNRVKLLWILGIITFFLSAVLDNLTTAIVMAALIRKLMKEKSDIWIFGGIIVLAANAGGAWSPIGDVTTIMLWIGGQVTAAKIVGSLFLPSLVCLVVPLVMFSLRLKGEVMSAEINEKEGSGQEEVTLFEKNLIFGLGISALLFVPIFKTLTHLPPFMGVLLGLSVLWLVTDVMHRSKNTEAKTPLSIAGVIRRIDTPSILFFLGILTAVSSLQVAGHLTQLSEFLDEKLGSIYAINTAIGVLSSIVDNVPLVAGAIGMYSFTDFPPDHTFWELLAYCAGTGGSLLIIGSAEGVAIMGILKIDFIWYMKHITLFAFVGYIAGIITYYFMN
jgi:Na+/H+ antiporter NhaD/arsenite permease-like protein